MRLSLTALIENVLDPAREAYGAPVRVNSGYRSLALNKAVGGSATSQHLRGEAADITTGTKEGNGRLFEIIKARGIFDQLIDEKNLSWIHVSYRTDLTKSLLHFTVNPRSGKSFAKHENNIFQFCAVDLTNTCRIDY